MIERFTGSWAPLTIHLATLFLSQLIKPLAIALLIHSPRGVLQLPLGQQFSIVRAAFDEGMNQRIPIFWKIFYTITRFFHRLKEAHQRGRCIQAHRIANFCRFTG